MCRPQGGRDHQGTTEGTVGDGGRRLPEPVWKPRHKCLELRACQVVASDQCSTQQCRQQDELSAVGVLAGVASVVLEQVRCQPSALAVTRGEQRGGTCEAERRHLGLRAASDEREMVREPEASVSDELCQGLFHRGLKRMVHSGSVYLPDGPPHGEKVCRFDKRWDRTF